MAPSAGELAIDLHRVEKTYGRKVRALRGIQMQVFPGEVFGLLGPNGAGKTTLVKIMMTAIRPNRAEGTILGRPVGHKPTLARVGYLPENHRFPPYLTGRQALEYYAALSKVTRPTRKRRAAELLEAVGMGDWANARVGAYSKGMQQRIGLAQALVNDPQLVVLDEPTDGLDPVARREVREVLKRLRGQGKTVFLNSHLLGEVERICDRVAILVEGKVVRQGTIEELTSRGRYYEIQVHGAAPGELREAVHTVLFCELQASESPPSVPEAAHAAPGIVPVVSVPPESVPVETGALPGGETVELEDSAVRVHSDRPAVVQPVIDALRSRGLIIHSVQLIRQSLEDYFIETVADTHGVPSAVQGPNRGERR